MRKWKERDCARRAAQTVNERQATYLKKSKREHERTAAEIPEERETRQQMSNNQRKRLAVEVPKERETRLRQMRDRLAAKTSEEREKQDYSR